MIRNASLTISFGTQMGRQ